MTGTNELAKYTGSTALLALIQRAATEDGFSIEKLEKLLDVKERWDAEEARRAFVAAVADFKSNPPQIVKDKQVDFATSKGRTQYRHATLGQVTDATAAGMAQPLAVSQLVSEAGTGPRNRDLHSHARYGAFGGGEHCRAAG